MDFELAKRRTLFKYEDALQSNLVDSKVIQLNSIINSMDNYFTTSSCAGRCILIEKSGVRSKYATLFHFKTHDPEAIAQLKSTIFKGNLDTPQPITFSGDLWMLLEAPNFHIRCRNQEDAIRIHKIALSSKLGLSKYQSLEPTIVVEILGTGRLQVPIGKGGNLIVDERYLDAVISEAESLLQEDQSRMYAFQKILAEL